MKTSLLSTKKLIQTLSLFFLFFFFFSQIVKSQTTCTNNPTSCASANTDLDMVRLTYREMLGDGTGVQLLKDKTVPEPILTWMRQATAGTALKDYQQWFKVLEKSFGARRFTELPLKPSDIYQSL